MGRGGAVGRGAAERGVDADATPAMMKKPPSLQWEWGGGCGTARGAARRGGAGVWRATAQLLARDARTGGTSQCVGRLSNCKTVRQTRVASYKAALM